MNVSICKELSSDHKEVFALIKKAFDDEPMSDGSEPSLVRRLRSSEAFVPELSLVAKLNNKLVGHILLTKLIIKNKESEIESLALAPVSVLPEYQNRGIGAQLIKAAHAKARELRFNSIVLVGHENYYPRFGYKQAQLYNISFPFDAPKQNCMAMELTEGGLDGVSGLVVYPKEFEIL